MALEEKQYVVETGPPEFYNRSPAALAAAGPTVAKIQQAIGYLQMVRDNAMAEGTFDRFEADETLSLFGFTVTAVWEEQEKTLVVVFNTVGFCCSGDTVFRYLQSVVTDLFYSQLHSIQPTVVLLPFRFDSCALLLYDGTSHDKTDQALQEETSDGWKNIMTSKETAVPSWLTEIAPQAQVYKMFLDELNAIANWDQKKEQVLNDLCGDEKPRRLLFVGHSVGGALATIQATRAATRHPQADVRLITFGSPRVGNAAFCSVVRWMTSLSYRVVIRGDGVPEKYPDSGILSGLTHTDNVVYVGKKDFARDTFKGKNLNSRRVWASVSQPRLGTLSNHSFANYVAAVAVAEFVPREIPSSQFQKFMKEMRESTASDDASNGVQSPRPPRAPRKAKTFSCISCVGNSTKREEQEIQDLAEKSFLSFKKDVDIATGKEHSMVPVRSRHERWGSDFMDAATTVFTIPTKALNETFSIARAAASTTISTVTGVGKTVATGAADAVTAVGRSVTRITSRGDHAVDSRIESISEDVAVKTEDLQNNNNDDGDDFLDDEDDDVGTDTDAGTTVLSDAAFEQEAADFAVEDGEASAMPAISMDNLGKLMFRGKIRQALLAAKASYYQADYKFQRVTGVKSSTIVKDKTYDTNLHVAWHDGTLILAARGTVSLTATIQDIKFFSWQVDFLQHFPAARAHIGFLDQVVSVTKGENSAMERAIGLVVPEGKVPTRVVVTGHSLGAGVATLFATWAAYRFPLADIRCITFGSPRVGNRFFTEAFGLLVGNSLRVVHARDPLINLPPSVTDNAFTHVDTYVFYMKGRALIGGRPKKLEFQPNNFDHYLYSYLRGARKLIQLPRGLQNWDEDCPDLTPEQLAKWNKEEAERLKQLKEKKK